MGQLGFPVEPMARTTLQDAARVLIVASPAEIARVEPLLAGSGLDDVSCLALDNGWPVPAVDLKLTRLLIIEVDPASASSMQRLAAIRESHPDVTVVAAIWNATVSLVRTIVRQGVADVVSLPLDPEEMLQVALDVMARRGAEVVQPAVGAPLVCVVRSVGGCGATTIATHLAAALGERDPTGRGALLADLDIQFGTVTDYLGMAPHGRLSDLLEAQGRLDEELLRSVAAESSGSLAVVAAPESIMPLEQIDTDQLLKIIQLFRHQYGVVVLDLPADWTSWTLSVAAAADVILMVTELSLPSLRQAKRRLELFRSVGIEDGTVQIVVNRAEKRLFGSIDTADVAKTLGHSVIGSVALDQALVSAAQNQGCLVGELRRKSRFATDIDTLADRVRARLDGQS